jgi:hypothetical protein
MNPEDLSLPENIQNALYCLLSEGWNNFTNVIKNIGEMRHDK